MAAAGVPDRIRAAWCGHTTAVNVDIYTRADTHAGSEDMPVAADALREIINAA